LAKGETGATPEEITRSYEIYNQLADIAAYDPRVKAIIHYKGTDTFLVNAVFA